MPRRRGLLARAAESMEHPFPGPKVFVVRPQDEACECRGTGGVGTDVHAHDCLRVLRSCQEHRDIGSVGVRDRLEQGQRGVAPVFLNGMEVAIVNASPVRMIDPLRCMAEGQAGLFTGLP